MAVVDTGVLLDHPDLEANLSHNGVIGDGYDFISDPDNARDGDGIDSNPYDVGDLGSGTGQSSFHGIHVAGTIAATTGNGIGGAGVGGYTKLMPLRVLGKYGGSDYDIIQAVKYAAGLPNDSNILPLVRVMPKFAGWVYPACRANKNNADSSCDCPGENRFFN